MMEKLGSRSGRSLLLQLECSFMFLLACRERRVIQGFLGPLVIQDYP